MKNQNLQLIQIHDLLPKMWTRLVQKAMRRNTGFPPWRTLAITLRIFQRSSSQEGSRRLWGDWRSTWKKRYWSMTEPSAEPCVSNDRRMGFFLRSLFFPGLGLQLWEAQDISKLAKSQHYCPQSLCDFWLPVCAHLLVETVRCLWRGECCHGCTEEWFLQIQFQTCDWHPCTSLF